MTQKTFIKEQLIAIFLRRNRLPAFLEYIIICIEIISYLVIIANNQFMSKINDDHRIKQTMLVVVISIIVIRRITGVSLTKAAYVIILSQLLRMPITLMSFLIKILLMFCVAFDTMSSFSLEFNSLSAQSQSFNGTKKYQYSVITMSLILYVYYNLNFVASIVSFALFILLFLLKRISLMKNVNYKELVLRLYILSAITNIAILIQQQINVPAYLKLPLIVLISQTIYEIYRYKKSQESLEQLFSQERFLKLSFQLCRYINDNKGYCKKYQNNILAFMGENYRHLSRNDQKSEVYKKVSSLLSRKSTFYEQILLAEIYIYNCHQYLKARHIIQKLKRQTPFYCIFDRVLLFRIEQTLIRQHKLKQKEIKFQNYQSYLQNEEFRSLIFKNSIQFLHLWTYVSKDQIQQIRLKTILNKVIQNEKKIKEEYQNIETKCMTINLLYSSYLFDVARNQVEASRIIQAISFNEDFEVNLSVDQKIFITLNLEDDPFRISHIGQNVSSLLGFSRKQIEGHPFSQLLPEFYRKSYNDQMKLQLENNFQKFYLYRSQNILKNKWGYYQQASIMLRANYNRSFTLQGYLKLSSNPRYNWNDYIFVKENYDVVECSENIPELINNPITVHRIDQYFNQIHTLTQPLIRREQNFKTEFHPLLSFQIDGQKVIYFVKADPISIFKNILEEMNPKDKAMNVLKTIQPKKFSDQLIQSYFKQLNQHKKEIYSCKYILLMIVAILTISGIIVLLIFSFQLIYKKQANQDYVLNICKSLLSYYNSTIKIGMGINYKDLNQQFNYTNNYVDVKFVEESLYLQAVNEKLKIFTSDTFTLPSLVASNFYSKANYDMIIELLSNAYLIQLFPAKNDFISNISLERSRISLQTIFTKSIEDYQNTFLSSIANLEKQTLIINFIILGVLFILLILCYVAILLVYYEVRKYQGSTFQLISSFPQQKQWIDLIKQFIQKISKQEITFAKENNISHLILTGINNISVAPESTFRAEVSRMSQMSLRQNTGRNLMENSFNKSMTIQQTTKFQSKFAPKKQVEITSASRNKTILLLPLLFIVLISGLLLSNQLINNNIENFNEIISAQNILSLYRTSSFYSRAVITFANLIPLKIMQGNSSLNYFDSYISQVNQAVQTLPFVQSSISDFSSFQTALSQIEYQYLCSYINCLPLYKSQINLAYETLIQKMVNKMKDYEKIIVSANSSQIQVQMNGNLKHQLDLMYYTEKIIRNILGQVVNIYFTCSQSYFKSISLNRKIIVGLAIAVFSLGFVFFILLGTAIAKNQDRLLRMVQLIKTDNIVQIEQVSNNNSVYSDKQK